MRTQALQQTGHAKGGFASVNVFSRASRLLSEVVRTPGAALSRGPVAGVASMTGASARRAPLCRPVVGPAPGRTRHSPSGAGPSPGLAAWARPAAGEPP